jgi:hypothetical protein
MFYINGLHRLSVVSRGIPAASVAVELPKCLVQKQKHAQG